jgi:hypothetical protein
MMIFLREFGKKIPLVNVDFEPITNIKDSLMCEFKNIKLPQIDKKLLSRRARSEILPYLNWKYSESKENLDEIINKINSTQQSEIHLETKGVSAFLCLCALFDSRLDKKKKITLHFKAVPLALFPLKLIEKGKLSGKHKIVIHIPKDDVLSQLPGLFTFKNKKIPVKLIEYHK